MRPGRRDPRDRTRSRRTRCPSPNHAPNRPRSAGAAPGRGCPGPPSRHQRHGVPRTRVRTTCSERRRRGPVRWRTCRSGAAGHRGIARGPCGRGGEARRSRPSCLAIASAPSPAASDPRTSRVNVGKTVMLENPQHLAHHDHQRDERDTSVPKDERHRPREARSEVRFQPFASGVSAPDDEAGDSHDRHRRRQDEREGHPETFERDTTGDRAECPSKEDTKVAERDGVGRPRRRRRDRPNTSAWRFPGVCRSRRGRGSTAAVPRLPASRSRPRRPPGATARSPRH